MSDMQICTKLKIKIDLLTSFENNEGIFILDEGISFCYLNIMVREPHVKCCSCISDFLCQPGASKSCERRPGDFIIIIILKFQSTLTLCTCLKLKQQ